MELLRLIWLTISLVFIGVNGQASDVCLECLMRHNPVDGCVSDSFRTFCGPYRISRPYFVDCMSGVSDKDFESCTSDVDCATTCVKTYQAKNAGRCLDNRQVMEGSSYTELTCADYGRMHFGGPRACSLEDTDAITQYLNNLTSLCGCLTVNGVCDGTSTTEGTVQKGDGLLLLYTIAPVCAVLILVTLFCCIRQLRKYSRANQRIVKDHGCSIESQQGTGKVKSYNQTTVNHYMPGINTNRQQVPHPIVLHSIAPDNALQTNTAVQLPVDTQYELALPVNDAYAMEDMSSNNSTIETVDVGEKSENDEKGEEQQPGQLYENCQFHAQNFHVNKSTRLPIPSPRLNSQQLISTVSCLENDSPTPVMET